MGVRFPTRPSLQGQRGHGLRGEPLRANSCKCDAPNVDPDGLCTVCGYWPKETVDQTWADQAKRTEGLDTPVSELDERHRVIREQMERRYGQAGRV